MLFKRTKSVEIKPRRKSTKPISAHSVFVPTLALWGAAVAGLGVYVLPKALTARIAQLSPVSIPEGLAHIAIAGIAAAIGAACMGLVATAVRRASAGGSDKETDDEVYTIDPAEELGSDSLDAPIEEDEIEFDEGYTPEAFNDFEPDWVEETGEAEDEAVEDVEENTVEDCSEPLLASKPLQTGRPNTRKIEMIQKLNGDLVRKEGELDSIARNFLAGEEVGDSAELDLGTFGDAPLEAPVVQQQAESEPVVATEAPKPETAIDKLRSVPPQELSLVQMIERLAVAIQHRKAAGATDPTIPQRDAQLAETLKTLGKFTEDGFDNHTPAAAKGDATEREMRDALARLRDVRGAA